MFVILRASYANAAIMWYSCISTCTCIGKQDSRSCVFESMASQESTLYPSRTKRSTSAVMFESSGCSVVDCDCIIGSSLFCRIWKLFRCSAIRRNTGHTFSRCGQDDQNQGGIRPVGAVDTRYPMAIGCWAREPTWG